MSGWLLKTEDGRQVDIHGGTFFAVDGREHEYTELPDVEEVISQIGNDLVVFADGMVLTTDDLAFVERIRQHLGVEWDEKTRQALMFL